MNNPAQMPTHLEPIADQEALCFLVYPFTFLLNYFSYCWPNINRLSHYLSKCFHFLRQTVQAAQCWLRFLYQPWLQSSGTAVFVSLIWNFAYPHCLLFHNAKYEHLTFLRYSNLIHLSCCHDPERTALMLRSNTWKTSFRLNYLIHQPQQAMHFVLFCSLKSFEALLKTASVFS